MSIVALKRKSLTQFGKAHVDHKGVFSLNGTTRHPPPTLGRSIQPTPMKGPEPKGHGCGRRCRVPGRFARICGDSYPRVIHSTCEPFQTLVHPSVKNQSGRLARLHLGKPVAKHPDTDLSALIQRRFCILERLEINKVNPLQVCPPFFKEVGSMSYNEYLLQTTSSCTYESPY